MGLKFGGTPVIDYSLNIQDLYRRYSQESIFYLVFGYLPTENVKVYSPFRLDKTPNCYFTYENGILLFVDFANSESINGVNLNNISSFYCVKAFYNLSYNDTFLFIYNKLKDIDIDTSVNTFESFSKKRVQICIYPVPFKEICKNFWSSYGISYQNLVDDKVFACSKILISSNKNYVHRFAKIAYVYTDFDSGNKKIYNPYYFSKENKFFTNCSQNDIGNFNNLKRKENIIITKSYKDCRVLINAGYDSIWLQNEGMIPNTKPFFELLKSYSKVFILFDNDNAGIKASKKLLEVLLLHGIFCTQIFVPFFKNVTDPSDLYKEKSKDSLNRFLKNNIK